MKAQIFFVTSVRGIVFPPQMVANAGERTLGAKIPTPFFFMASARAFPAAFFAAVIFFKVALVGFVVFAFGVVVFFVAVFLVISIKRWKCAHDAEGEDDEGED